MNSSLSPRSAPSPATCRIDCDADGVDDVAIGPVEMFRFEMMSDKSFWMQVYLPDGSSHRFCGQSRGKITVGHEAEPAETRGEANNSESEEGA